jgi:hypothetical protein
MTLPAVRMPVAHCRSLFEQEASPEMFYSCLTVCWVVQLLSPAALPWASDLHMSEVLVLPALCGHGVACAVVWYFWVVGSAHSPWLLTRAL